MADTLPILLAIAGVVLLLTCANHSRYRCAGAAPARVNVILAEIKANQKWIYLANSEDERIVLDTMKYLTDRAYGKARQAVEVTGAGGGPLESSITVIFVRPDRD